MKKQYEAPEAKKVEFSYEENVTASAQKKTNWNYTPVQGNCWGWEPPTCKEVPEGCKQVSDKL